LEVLVEYDKGNRFVASCGGYQVTSGTGDDGDVGKDGMWPAQLFVASLGMCIGGYVVSYCGHHGIACEGLRVELSRETARAPSRTTRVTAKIYLGAEVSQKDAEAILRVADQCHITNSIKPGLQVVCSLGDGQKEQLAVSRPDRGRVRTTR
jgi:putative redox protein